MELNLRLRLMLQFEYEVREESLNLYDRIDREKGVDTLRFLGQVPFEGDLEASVRNAVETSFRKSGHIIEPDAVVCTADLRTRRKPVSYITE